MHSIRFLGVSVLALAAMPSAAQRRPAPGPTVTSQQSRTEAPSPPNLETGGIALTAADVNAWLDGYMPYALKTNDIAGAVAVVVKDGEILTERGFGYSDVGKHTPVDPTRTLFRPGSVSKLFTWTAVMQLVEQGKINLDTDINPYLDFKIPARDGQPITMRNLMQHTPGFEQYVKDGNSYDPKTALSFEAWVKRWTPERIFPAGTTPAYSNYGAALAGYIVQRVSGEPFDSYIERHIFTPLDMQHSTFRQPLPASLAPLMSNGYDVASKEPTGFEFISPVPAGSLSSSGQDVAHFMIAHLQDGAYRGKRILQPATAKMMHDSPLTVLPPLNRMELGFFETNINGREVIAHLGDTQGFHTALHLFLKEDVGFYVSFNSLGKAAAAGSLRGAMFEDFADRYFPGAGEDGRVDAITAAQHVRMMAGNWIISLRSESNFLSALGLITQLKIRVGPKGELVLPIMGLNGQPRKWMEIAPFVWRDAGSHQRLAAKVVEGKVVRFSFDGISPFIVFDRAPWYRNTAWLLPLIYVSLATLAITAMLWPIRAIIRRRYGATLTLDPPALRAFRLSRIGAVAIIAAVAGWVGAMALLFSGPNYQHDSFDPVLWLVEIFGAIAFFGGAALMIWNLRIAWIRQRPWPARVWSIVLVLSALIVLWVAIAFKLTSFGVNY